MFIVEKNIPVVMFVATVLVSPNVNFICKQFKLNLVKQGITCTLYVKGCEH